MRYKYFCLGLYLFLASHSIAANVVEALELASLLPKHEKQSEPNFGTGGSNVNPTASTPPVAEEVPKATVDENVPSIPVPTKADLERLREHFEHNDSNKFITGSFALSLLTQKELNTWFLESIKENKAIVIIKALLEAGADVNAKDYAAKGIFKWRNPTALMIAAVWGYQEVVELLLQAGAAVNEKDDVDMTALIYAAKEGGHLKVVELLLQAGAAVNEKNNDGWTALMCAAIKGRLEVIELLLQAKAAVNEKNRYAETALMYAAKEGYLEVVELLLQAGADVNEKNDGDMTALTFSLIELLYGFTSTYLIIKKLLIAGADVTIGDAMQLLRSLPNSPAKRNILLIFDALKPGIEQEKGTGLEAKIFSAYEEFLHGKHAELRNLLLVLPGVMKEKMKNDHRVISDTFGAMLNVFERESIAPLLYFLAEKQYQRDIADIIVGLEQSYS